MTHIVGIDPGKKGAIATMDAHGGDLCWRKMPVHEGEYDLLEISRLISWWTNLAGLIVLEKIHALPSNMGGSFANYSRGEAMGIFKLAAMVAGVDIRLIAPQTWQKEMLQSVEEGTTKERSIRVVNNTYRLGLGKNDDGVADAILIAEYGRRRWLAREGR